MCSKKLGVKLVKEFILVRLRSRVVNFAKKDLPQFFSRIN